MNELSPESMQTWLPENKGCSFPRAFSSHFHGIEIAQASGLSFLRSVAKRKFLPSKWKEAFADDLQNCACFACGCRRYFSGQEARLTRFF
ncbi:MAG: hypothetical protein AAB316_20645 [Bacteroidota bacterium]